MKATRFWLRPGALSLCALLCATILPPGDARAQADPASKTYTDLALTPVEVAEEEDLEMFHLNETSEAAVAKAKSEAEARARVAAQRNQVAAAE